MTVYEILKQLEATPGTNDKIAILKANSDNEDLKEFFRLALDPQINFWIKKIPAYNAAGVYNLDTLMNSLQNLSNRTYTGKEGISFLTEVLEGGNSETADVICRIIKKDPNCKVSAKTVNKVWENLILIPPYMCCEKYTEKNLERITFPSMIQTKADGAFTNIVVKDGEVTFLSRNGSKILLDDSFNESFRAMSGGCNTVFHGEGLVLDKNGKIMPRKKGNGIFTKAIKGTIKQEEIDGIFFKLWDMMPYEKWLAGKDETSCNERFENLQEAIAYFASPRIELTNCSMVNSLEAAYEFYQEQIDAGEEGAILKNMNSPWENRTSKNCVKMKVEDECDLLIVGWEPHSKKEGWIGALYCESSCGKLKVRVGSGLSDDDRQKDPKEFINKIGTVRYNEVIDSKDKDTMSLFLPRLIETREFEKSEADSLEKILAA